MNTAGLLSRQVAPASALLASLATHNAALDGSDMGTGKTYVAGAVIRDLDLPTLVVCPAISITGWRRAGAHLGVEFEAQSYEMLRGGNTPFGCWENPLPKKRQSYLVCEVCKCEVDVDSPRPCHLHQGGIHCVEVKKHPHKYGKFFWAEQIKFLVFDEVHRCAALDSLQADMLIAARRQRIKTLALSATVADSPLQLRALGYVLGLHNLIDSKAVGSPSGFFQWARRQGCQKLPFGGFHFAAGHDRKRTILSKLHSEIFTCRGTRVRVADLPDFPKCQITAELYDLEASGRIDELYAKMEHAIAEAHAQAEGRKQNSLTGFLGEREEIELLKVPIFEELYDDALTQGLHVAIFVNFRRTVDELCKRLKLKCRVDGSQTGPRGAAERQAHVDDFLHDRSPGIVLTTPAGSASIGLQDIYGNFPRLGLVSLGASARDTRQVFGRLPREGAKSKSRYRVILISGTVEENTHQNISGKLDCLDTLNDNDLFPCNLNLRSFERVLQEGD